jgi:ATP-dependent Lhr-like helicase
MKDDSLPASIVCTTTLELGIDIGNIESVAQIGAGHTVSGMRQRLGRSGRRTGQEAIFRVYTLEHEFGNNIHPTDALRPNTVQAIAMIELMLKRWNEPPNTKRLHLSTMMHQTMALICQYGGLTAQQSWTLLVESGVFKNIDKPLFVQLLKRMGDPEVRLLEQASDGTLLLGAEGERITASFDFYAVFETPEEYKVVNNGREIGKLPMALPYQEGHLLIFGGRYWRVLGIDTQHREILVEKAKGGRPPKFSGEMGPQSDVVVAEMQRVYTDVNIPRYLDKTAVELLQEARKAFMQYDLLNRRVIEWDDGFLLFPWLGSAGQRTLQLAFIARGLKANAYSIAISVENCEKSDLQLALLAIQKDTEISAESLAALLPEKTVDKFDHYLDSGLQAKNFAAANLDTSQLIVTATKLLNDLN